MNNGTGRATRLKGGVAAAALTMVLGAGLIGAPSASAAGADANKPAKLSDERVEWLTLGNDYAHTRYSPANHVTPENLPDLDKAWVWDGASFDARSGRSTPSYIDGILYTVAGPRRHVVALDPATGELLWSYREPNTFRHEYSMRKDYGKGVAYAKVDGRGVIYIVSPGFFLTALDAKTGKPLEGFGKPVPIEGFPKTGVVDLLGDLADEHDPYYGIPLEKGYITSSSPPIVVNGVVIVGNSAEQGYNQSRVEMVPGDILAYDAKTGEFLWKFKVIPGPGEFGHETWENDAWKWTGDISSWAPLSADPERGIVYVPTNGATVDFYGGFRPGDNLFSTSLIALDVKTGKRVWHYQLVHHDIWNYDTPTAPILLDVTVDGKKVPIVAQATKQSMVFTFNRETGEPIWPIEERPVPASLIPGEQLAKTQPFVTRPAPFDIQGITEGDLIDFTPELHARAVEIMKDFQMGPLFNPPLHRDNDLGFKASIWCPGDNGGVNIYAPPVADPVNGVLYVPSMTDCTSQIIASGEERDALIDQPTGTTFSDYAVLRRATPRGPDGLELFKPPYSRITAIDMNTGDHLWMIPVGETPQNVLEHPDLQDVDLPNTGTGATPPMLVTPSMVLYASTASDGTPTLFGVDKRTGEELARVEVPETSRYGMMTYVHDGRQYVILQTGPRLTALALD
ncbi:MAG TPA: PQQ-binding-like beta-propeller repeat protein [Pseudomonadales bacterium]|nr:PQQ-binding-like beta-propeller repeat protein [Pseudomonadales bacterium]